MDLKQYYDKKWEENKDQYVPDPAMEVTYGNIATLMELIRELEKITKRK